MTDTEIKNRIESLARLDDATWESLCKCCGVCCMLKHSRHTGTYYTSVACNNLNLGTRRCAVYSTRLNNRVFCARVDLSVVLRTGLLPDSCGYIEYIYGPAPIQIRPDFSKVIHERDMSHATPVSQMESGNSHPRHTTPGPWNHIIDDSLGWRTRAMELRDKYADFGRDILGRIARTTQK